MISAVVPTFTPSIAGWFPAAERSQDRAIAVSLRLLYSMKSWRLQLETSQRSTPRAGWIFLIVWLAVMVSFLIATAVWTEMSPWVIFIWVAMPTVAAVLIFIGAGRRGSVSGDSYEISFRSARAEGRLAVDLRIDEVPAAIEQVVAQQPRFSAVELTGEHAEIRGRMNFKTWGMTTHLKYRSLNPEQVEITAFCEPRLGTTLVDYGQGRQDIRSIFQGLENFEKDHDRKPVT